MGSSASGSDDEDSDGFSFVTSSTFDTFSLVYPSGSSSHSEDDEEDSDLDFLSGVSTTGISTSDLVSSVSDSDDEDSDGFSFVTSSTFDTFSLVSSSGSSSDSEDDEEDFDLDFLSGVSTTGFPLQTWFLLLQIQMMRILMAFPL